MQPQFITIYKNSIDITGQRFGKLVALGPIQREPGKHVLWLCQCDCGNTHSVRSHALRKGLTQSCGCIQKETPPYKTHGMSRTHLYRVWQGMIGRCTNPNARMFEAYGGRNISVCDEWRHDFKTFLAHISALPHCGEEGYTLDRINNDGNYEPGNVRWATQAEQTRNTRQNRMITYKSKTLCLSDWANELGMTRDLLWGRIRLGWDIERAFNEPLNTAYSRSRR